MRTRTVKQISVVPEISWFVQEEYMYLTLATINKQGTGHDPISQFTSK